MAKLVYRNNWCFWFPVRLQHKKGTQTVGGGGEGDKERDPLGSPSAVEGGEVKPQMLEVITTLETRVVWWALKSWWQTLYFNRKLAPGEFLDQCVL